MTGTITYAAIAKYMSAANNGAVNVVVSQDALIRAMNKAPNGMNWSQLMQAFAKV
jgi:hypothetical protein